jgi:hypothetical protein
MNDVTTLIKQTALDAVEADKPVAVMYGTVESVSPLTIVLEQKLRLSGEQITVFRGANFTAGNAVLLLREQGGQRFAVLGVV